MSENIDSAEKSLYHFTNENENGVVNVRQYVRNVDGVKVTLTVITKYSSVLFNIYMTEAEQTELEAKEAFTFDDLSGYDFNVEDKYVGDTDYEIHGEITYDLNIQFYCELLDEEPEELGWELCDDTNGTGDI